MPTATGGAFQHHQPDGFLLTQDQFLKGIRLLRIVTVHIVKEEATDALAASYQAIHMTQIIGQLQKVCFGFLITLARFGKLLQILLRVSQSHQLLAIPHRMRQLAAFVVVSYPIDHKLSPFFFRLP